MDGHAGPFDPDVVDQLIEYTIGGHQHLYISTSCLHGLHDRCGTMQHDRGEPGAPRCKFCPAVCACPVCRHGVPAEVAA